jgi:tryptophan synthase beta chain
MYDKGIVEARAYAQTQVLECGTTFARAEGIVPAPESAHAVTCAIHEALEARRLRTKKVILFNLSGHGLLDLSAYEQHLAGTLTDHAPSDDEINASLRSLIQH